MTIDDNEDAYIKNRNRGVRDPELRFLRATEWGDPPAFDPSLGPCLIYQGADNGNGYGQFRHSGSSNYAHRYAWERERGAIPEGMTVDHLCRVRMCVNIVHLELVDRVENFLRAVAVRTHCPNGHEYTPENLLSDKRGAGISRCRTCVVAQRKRGGLKRNRSVQGLPDRRFKYDAALRDSLALQIVEKRLTPMEAAEILGCKAKYMDKRARIEARKRGIANRRDS